jgi:ABC-type lipoprotein export system ATPase subunit
MENEVKICQSCGMPIGADKHKGTNEDGSLSNEYCSYCFKKGKFTNSITLDEQVEIGLNYYQPYKKAKTQEEKDLIRQQSKEFLSNLERWK